MLNITKDQAKSQINNFWGYLDELAEKNPDEYKKLISEQMKKGFESHSTPKDESVPEEKEIKVRPLLCLRFKVLQIHKHKEKDDSIKIHDGSVNMKELPKILFSFEFQSSSYQEKILVEPKIYLNIVYSDKFKEPTDENGRELKNPRDENYWKFIPTEFRYNGKKLSMSSNLKCNFYDVVVHSIVVEKMLSSEEMKKSILAYMVRKFSVFISDKYKLWVDNVKILKDKNYKSLKPVPQIFKLNNQTKSANSVPGKSNPPAKNFLEENKIKVPAKSENFPHTSTFYNIDKKKEPENKKILIEEVGDKKNIEIKKKVVSKTEMEVKFDFSAFDGITLKDIDLQISEKSVKLHLEDEERFIKGKDYDPVEMDFDFLVDPDECTAKFNKINKTLAVILYRKINS